MNIVKSVLRVTATTATALALLAGPCALPATAQTPVRPAALAPAQQAKRPHVIVILVDDMGFSDLGPYGSEITTPNTDALAANGLRLTHFYNNATCPPPRA